MGKGRAREVTGTGKNRMERRGVWQDGARQGQARDGGKTDAGQEGEGAGARQRANSPLSPGKH